MHKNEIDFITLGCSKNLVDTERLMYRLMETGFRCVHDSDRPLAEIAVINTCGFIGDAKEESVNTILEFAERKKRHQLSRLYVMGCLSERYREELRAEIPEVDRFFGKFDYMDLIDELSAVKQSVSCEHIGRHLTTPSHYAYLKIAEGCDRRCTYCAIPIITGRYKSRPTEEILEEAKWLAGQGVREFQLIAQDLTGYGTDLYGENRLPELVERIADIKGVDWIRLHYAYPTGFPMGLLRVMRERDNVCKYLDIALQHCSDHILNDMHRHITKQEQTDLIEAIRREVPGICLRTTLMVGFPTETDADFDELMDYTRQMRFDRMGAFAYSEEEGTFAQRHFPDIVPEPIKQQRLDRLMDLQQQIADELAQDKIGKTLKVIIDREEDMYFVARSEFDSPEVDPEILIAKESNGPLQTGQFYQAVITDYENFDFHGKIIEN